MVKKVIKFILVIALVALVVIQFIRPNKNDGGYQSVEAFEKETKPSTQIAQILKTNCYDCHSDQTNYPWYSQISPVNYWLDDHIVHGKHHFNVSAWASYSTKQKDHKLDELIEMVEAGEMPLNSYTWLHGNLSAEDKEILLQWAVLAKLQYQKQLEVSTR